MAEKAIRMCIIDDVKSVVDSIATNVDWKEHGVEVAGTATNGEVGLEMILRLKPDILFTDIRMPKLNGLDMLKEVLPFIPDCKIIVISGYSDFEYVQAALRLGAFDYVMKPITPNEMVRIVLKAKQELEARREKESIYRSMEEQIRESMPLLKQNALNTMVRHMTPSELARKRWGLLDIDLEGNRFIVMLIEIDRYGQFVQTLNAGEIERLLFAVHNIVEETIEQRTKGAVVREPNTGRLLAIVKPVEGSSLSELAELCRSNVEKYADQTTVSIGIGTEVDEVERLPYSYRQAKTALSYQFYTGGNSVYRYEDVRVSEKQAQFNAVEPEREQEFLYALRSGHSERMLELLDRMVHSYAEHRQVPRPEHYIGLFDHLLLMANRIFAEKIPEPHIDTLHMEWQRLQAGERSSLKELQRQIRDYCLKGCKLIRNHSNLEANELIQKAIAYIGQRLHTNVTVNDCAREVHLSASYFANLFKKVTGMTVVQYMTSERLERAKALLLEGHQVQDVAEAVGYEDRPYFSEIFKKHVGMNPTEFKMKALKK